MRYALALVALLVAGLELDAGWRRCRRTYNPAPVPICYPAPSVGPAPAPAAVLPQVPAEIGLALRPTAPPATLIGPDGARYQVITSAFRNRAEETEPEVEDTAAAASGDIFKGKSRKAAKLSIANAPEESFPSVKALLATLPSEAHMESLDISRGPTSNRKPPENRNVVVKAFLFAASKESDNDFHLIIGDTGPNPRFLTVEISGLAKDGSSPAGLKQARANFKTIMGNQLPGDRYKFYNPPMPVRVGGSLFFDVEHADDPPQSRPGPASHKPRTVWEIHPITSFQYGHSG